MEFAKHNVPKPKIKQSSVQRESRGQRTNDEDDDMYEEFGKDLMKRDRFTNKDIDELD